MRNETLSLVAVLVAFSLQGCGKFFALKPAVQIAIGHACSTAADGVSEDEGLKDLAQTKGCDKLKEDKLKALGVEDCAQVLHTMIHAVMMTECANLTANSVQTECEPFTDDCPGAVDTSVKGWKPALLDISEDEQESEDKEGAEATLALVEKCHATSEDLAEEISDEAGKDCDETDETMEKMGMDAAKCKKFGRQAFTLFSTLRCVVFAMKHEETPESPDDVTEELLDKVVDEFAAGEKKKIDGGAGALSEDEVRLFETVIKGRKWQKVRKTSVAQIAVYGAAAAVALLAVIAVSMKRRNSQVVQLDEEMLMANE